MLERLLDGAVIELASGGAVVHVGVQGFRILRLNIDFDVARIYYFTLLLLAHVVEGVVELGHNGRIRTIIASDLDILDVWT